MLDVPVEELKFPFLLLAGQGARVDDVLQLHPIPSATTFLLSHQIQEVVSFPPSSLIIMSHISSSKKVHSSWKISDSSRIYPSEESIRDVKISLPEKFSPVKGTSRDSKIFTASKEKIKLLRPDRSPRDSNRTPTKRDSLLMVNHLSLKESLPLVESPQRVKTEREPELQSRQSLVLHNLESDSPALKRKSVKEINYELLKSQQEYNLRAIHQLRIDFIDFKNQVWTQLHEQKNSIAKIAAELAAKIEQTRMAQIIQVVPTEKQAAETVHQPTAEVMKQVGEVSKQQIEEVSSQIEHFSNHLEKKYSELKVDCIEIASPPQPATPNSKDIDECRTPIEKLVEVERMPERKCTPLDKCNQIVETIGILSEINSSPVNTKTKSIEKVNIEEYKQKLISVTRSNDILIREPLRAQLREDKLREDSRAKEESKLKGSFKLDKFYNAIEKLKEEVNEIRNINDMKQIKKLRILKVHE